MANEEELRESIGGTKLHGHVEESKVTFKDESIEKAFRSVSDSPVENVERIMEESKKEFDTLMDRARQLGESTSVMASNAGLGAINLRLTADLSEYITGLKAVQREAKKATQALREVESLSARKEEPFIRIDGEVVGRVVAGKIRNASIYPLPETYEDLKEGDRLAYAIAHLLPITEENAIKLVGDILKGKYL